MGEPPAVHRVWWITDVPAGPLVITAAAAEADIDWLDTRAEELIATLSFETTE